MSEATCSITVRPTNVADAHALAVTHVAAWQAAYVGIVGDERLRALRVADRTRRWVELLARPQPEITHLVAELAGDVVGYGVAGPLRDPENDDDETHTGELYVLNVHPATWRRGVGSALLRRLTEALVAGNRYSAHLWVFKENIRGRQFYEHHGWRATGVQRNDAPGDTPTELRYMCDLTSCVSPQTRDASGGGP